MGHNPLEQAPQINLGVPIGNQEIQKNGQGEEAGHAEVITTSLRTSTL
jgi:hypothetical protein